jgi:hypothetical protein
MSKKQSNPSPEEVGAKKPLYTVKYENVDIEEIKSLKGKIGDVELDFPEGVGHGSIKIDGKEISQHLTELAIYIEAYEPIKIKMMFECFKLEEKK